MHNASLNDKDPFHPPPSYRASASAFPSHSASPSRPPPPLSPITRRTSLLPHQHSRPPVEHLYSLFDSRNEPWASLKLLSNVGSPRFLPAYFEGQTIQGKLELDIRKPETILGISVTVSGTIMAANAPDPRVFWELTRIIWNTDMGEPRPSSHTQIPGSAAASSSKAKEKAYSKLVGSYSFSFSIQLPSTCLVTLRSKHPPVTLPLPPSFSEKGAAQFINYEITVRIRRGPLRIDSKLGTHFGFAPRTRPPAPSFLRQLAYQDNRPLVGPDGDPDGWTVLPPIIVRGKLFGVRMVEAICTFALALPMTYSRGHPLPLMLTITCSDSQALDLVFAPHNISVHLIREVCYDTGCPESSSSKRWGTGLESSPADLSLGVTASTPARNFSSRAYLPRAVPQSEQLGMAAASSSSFASASTPTSASGSGRAGSVGTSNGGAASSENASLAQSRQHQSSLYSHPSATTASVAASSTLSSLPPTSPTSASASSSSIRTTSTSTLSLSLSALSFFSSLSFGSRSTSRLGEKEKDREKEKREGKEKERKKNRMSRIYVKDKEKEKEREERERAPKVGPKLALHGARTPITSAVWWPRQSGASVNVGDAINIANRGHSESVVEEPRTRTRRFEGEILLPKDLVPSFEFGGFSVKYALALLPFQAPGFELTTSTSSTSAFTSLSSPPSSSTSPFSPYSPSGGQGPSYSSPPPAFSSPSSPSSHSPYPSFSPPTSTSPSSFPSSSSVPASTSSSTPLRLTHEPLLLSKISIATLPYTSPSPSASTLGSPGSSSSLSIGTNPTLSSLSHHPSLSLSLPPLPPLPLSLSSSPPLPPGIALAASASATATMSSTPRSRAPPEVDAHAQRAAHADRVKKPVVWGLFNQFESGGPSAMSGAGVGAID